MTGPPQQVGRVDPTLVLAAQEGDREAFSLLASGSVDRLYAIARVVLRDADRAEDAVQEALVRCWRDLPSLRDPAAFDAWLRRILMHTITNEFRRGRRHEAHVRVIDQEPAVPDGTALTADRDAIERGFRRLSVEHRAVLVLRHLQGLSVPEVADALGVPVGTAKSRLHYATEALRAVLDADARASRDEEATA
jgi:RNA polymerase sigma-70 factor, ECF subfamily